MNPPQRPVQRSTDPIAGHLNAEAADPALPVTVTDVEAMIRRDLLQADETILLLTKPGLLYVPLTCLPFAAWVALGAMLLVVLGQRGLFPQASSWDIAALAMMAIGLRMVWQALDWASRIYILTDRRVLRIKGVLNVKVFQAPLKNIQHTQLHLPLTQRLLGLGTIIFFTSGSAFADAAWSMVRNPVATQHTVLKAIERYGR